MKHVSAVDAQNYAYQRNELLCYVFNHVHRSTVASLTDCINDFYKPAEIAEARDLLWRVYEPLCNELRLKKQRRPAQPADRTAAGAYAEDIGAWAIALMNERPDDIHTLFFAVDLDNIPPCPPEEVNIFSLVTRVAALEKEAASTASSMADLRRQVEQQRSAPRMPWMQQQPKPAPKPALYNEADASVPQPRPVGGTAASNSKDDDDWTTVKQKSAKRRENRAAKRANQRKVILDATKTLTAVTGTGNDDALKASAPVSSIFVHGVDKECTADILSGFLKRKGVTPREVRLTSRKTALSASFRCMVPEDKRDATLRPDFWPQGVKCREWLMRVPKWNATAAEGSAGDDDSGGEDDAFDDAEETALKQTNDG